ncbi:MAG: Asp23/Gls24 family envelope stress response protein [Chloroflexi bacterium]|nr:Asp23/Gls24 family envelope stress response protein [Chloroflexota bacterium]
MTSEYHSAGKTTLTPDVFLTIARMAALEVEGVHSMAPVKGGLNSLLGRGNDGVRMIIEDSNVFVDLFLILESEVNIREVSRKVQLTVARAITEMTGLDAGHVNVHIEDIYHKAEA